MSQFRYMTLDSLYKLSKNLILLMSQKENNMRICEVFGNLTSEKSSENYPTDLYCTECFLKMNPEGDDSKIVNHSDDDGSFGDTCSNCGKTRDEDNEFCNNLFESLKKNGFSGLNFDDYLDED